MDQKTLEIVSAIAYDDGLDCALTNIRSSFDRGLFPPDGDKSICNEYDGCIIPFHECLFSLIGFCLPFYDFEINVMTHLMIYPSQLHPVSWGFVKVFQHWC